VAHTHGPEHTRQKRTIALDELVVPEPPTFVAMTDSTFRLSWKFKVKFVKQLSCWGHSCSAFCFGEHDTFLCFSNDFVNDLVYHYMFLHSHVSDEQGRIKHSQSVPMTSQNAMKFLDSLGYARAIVLSEERLGKNIHRIIFCNNTPQFTSTPHQPRTRTEWPQRQVPQEAERALFPTSPEAPVAAVHSVSTGFDFQDALELLEAGKSFLQTAFETLELPDFINEAIHQTSTSQYIDRWLIYTDGSSQAKMRSLAPRHADDLGQPDTWAMLVVGERPVS